MYRSGFVAVLGRPNVGKSTLVNAMVGEKISIVTSRPHTTRHAILGILTRPDSQIVFIDTPGLAAKTRRLLNRAMNKAAVSALANADLALFVVDAGRWSAADDYVLDAVREAGIPCVLAVNKLDLVRPRDSLLPILDDFAKRHAFAAVVPISAKNGINLDRLAEQLQANLPEQEVLYTDNRVTNRDLAFRVAETMREKLTEMLHQEVPYGLGIEISQLEEQDDGRLVADITIWIDRESHKGIVLGRRGERLRDAGTAARLELQAALDRPVHLQSHVKVKRNWADNEQALRELGYDGEL